MNARILFARIVLTGVVVLLSAAGDVAAQHPLESWVRRSVPGPSPNLYGVAYGNGVFVAVGQDSFVTRSSDGVTWVTSSAGAFGNLATVRFLNGQFIAMGSSDKILFSTDGASWSASSLPQANFWDVAWGNGVYVIAGSGTYVSTDGTNWSATHPRITNSPPYSGWYETGLGAVTFGNGGFLALHAGGCSPTYCIQRRSLFSTDGVHWVAGGKSPGGGSELVFADGRWVGTAGGDLFVDGVLVSTNNGGDWCCTFNPAPQGGKVLAYGAGYVLRVVRQLTSVWASTNALNWQLRFQGGSDYQINSATFGNGTFVLAGLDASGASCILQSGNFSGVPSIFQEPQDRGAVAMNPATFSVQAVGAPTLTYQWYKNGSLLANATNTSYSIASVETSDSGGYQAVIANSFGSVTSRVAQLTVAFLGIDCYAGIKVLGVPGRTYRIEATPATGTPNWGTLTNLVLPSSPYLWFDLESPNLPTRLYRAAELP